MVVINDAQFKSFSHVLAFPKEELNLYILPLSKGQLEGVLLSS